MAVSKISQLILDKDSETYHFQHQHDMFMNFLKVSFHVKTLNCSKFTTAVVGGLEPSPFPASHRCVDVSGIVPSRPRPLKLWCGGSGGRNLPHAFVWVQMKERTKSSTFFVV